MVAELVVDEVEAAVSRRRPATFREVEIELGPTADQASVSTLVGALEAAGAVLTSGTSKLARSLGRRAQAAPDVAPCVVPDDPTAADVVNAALATSIAHLLTHLPVADLGDDDEGVHQARVATRRLRSDLRTFGVVLDQEQITPIREELSWLAEALGAVRDLDVLSARLSRRFLAGAGSDHVDTEAVARVVEAVGEARDRAQAALGPVIEGDRARALLEGVVALAADPPFIEGSDRAALEALVPAVRKRWRRVQRAVRALDEPPAVPALHEIRILVKKVRYAAEAVSPAAGKRARRFARAAAELQEILGELNDADVARRHLLAIVGPGPAPVAFTAGQMAQQLATEAEEHAAAWRPAYHRLAHLDEWLTDS